MRVGTAGHWRVAFSLCVCVCVCVCVVCEYMYVLLYERDYMYVCVRMFLCM